MKIIILSLLIASVQAKIKINNVLVDSTNIHYLSYVRHLSVPIGDQNGPVWDSGNNIQGKTVAEIQQIVDAIKQLETSLRQKEIPARMMAAPTEVFNFTDLNHAKNTVTQRLETIKMMEVFNTPGSRYWYASPHQNPPIPHSTTAAHWEKSPKYPVLFRQKSGTPYEAISQLCDPNSLTKGECYGAITACVWWGASRGMGEPAFNLDYTILYNGPNFLDMDFKNGNSSGTYNTKPAVGKDKQYHVPGDWLYMKNHDYDKVIGYEEFLKKKWIDPSSKSYVWSGENALFYGTKNGEEKYEGLGLTDLSETDFRNELRKNYNLDLKEVILNKGAMKAKVLDETFVFPVTEIEEGAEAEFKIKWAKIARIKH